MPDFELLTQKAKNIRKDILIMTTEAGSGHIAGPMGIADIYSYLYFYEFERLKVELGLQNIIEIPMILSCAHYAPVLYSTLIEKGIIPQHFLMTLRKLGSPLQGHTKRNLQFGIYNTGGSLGQGLGLACGMAIAKKNKNISKNTKIFCQISDGECNEGSIWESAMMAAKFRLDNLTVFLDRNGIQQSGNSNVQMPLEPLVDKWESFGWNVVKLNGNEMHSIHTAFSEIKESSGKPNIIIAYTTPGKGYSKIENNYHWHGKVLPSEMLAEALAELK